MERERWRRWSARGGVALGLLTFEAFLVVAVVAGAQAGQHQLIRHGGDTVRVTATVTDTVRQCTKGSCTWISLGTYEVGGRVQRGVIVVDSSRHEERGPQTLLVDPDHPRRAVNVHDHGWGRLVLAPLALVALVAGNTWLVRDWRRTRRRRAEPDPVRGVPRRPNLRP